MKVFSALVLSAVLLMSGCVALSIQMTPKEVKESVAKTAAVARYAALNPPTGADLQSFLDMNAEAWTALCEYYGYSPIKEK